jgi:hypothetical protein
MHGMCNLFFSLTIPCSRSGSRMNVQAGPKFTKHRRGKTFDEDVPILLCGGHMEYTNSASGNLCLGRNAN